MKHFTMKEQLKGYLPKTVMTMPPAMVNTEMTVHTTALRNGFVLDCPIEGPIW